MSISINEKKENDYCFPKTPTPTHTLLDSIEDWIASSDNKIVLATSIEMMDLFCKDSSIAFEYRLRAMSILIVAKQKFNLIE